MEGWKIKLVTADRWRININDPGELHMLRVQFPGKSWMQIIEAVKRAGPKRTEVIKYLKGHASL